jgi:hypothetical protein
MADCIALGLRDRLWRSARPADRNMVGVGVLGAAVSCCSFSSWVYCSAATNLQSQRFVNVGVQSEGL